MRVKCLAQEHNTMSPARARTRSARSGVERATMRPPRLPQLETELEINIFIIWQGKVEVNPSVLIGSFLVGILPYGPFPWKRSYAVYFFGFRKPRRQIQTTKRKRSNTLIFAKKLPKRLIFYRAYNKNEEHKYSRSEFYYPEDLMQRLTQASAKVKTIL